MKTLGLLLLGLCYLILIIHVVRTLWGHFRPPHPLRDGGDVTYMGKQAKVLCKSGSRSVIIMKDSGARAWVKNKNLKRKL